MILTLFTTIFGVTFLYYVAKYAWKWYILWKARDPMSPYGELPIPPGDFGLPIIGETHFWALQVGISFRCRV